MVCLSAGVTSVKFHKRLSVSQLETDNQTHRSDQGYLGPIKKLFNLYHFEEEKTLQGPLKKQSSPCKSLFTATKNIGVYVKRAFLALMGYSRNITLCNVKQNIALCNVKQNTAVCNVKD